MLCHDCISCCRALHTAAYPLCREDVRFTIFVPSNLKYLSCPTPLGARPDIAAQSRLTQLVVLDLDFSGELTQPLPPLPALLFLHVWTEDLQTVSSLAPTLQELSLYALHIDFRPPNTLAQFTCLVSFSCKQRCVVAWHSMTLGIPLGSFSLSSLSLWTLTRNSLPRQATYAAGHDFFASPVHAKQQASKSAQWLRTSAEA